MKLLRYILLTVVVLLFAIMVICYWPESKILDLSHDEEPFRSLVLPLKSIKRSYWMDGGSVSVDVTDQNGLQIEITFPIARGGTGNNYPTVYIGNINHSPKIPLKDPARAKEIMIRLLRDYGRKADKWDQLALSCLSGRMTDLMTRWILFAKELFK